MTQYHAWLMIFYLSATNVTATLPGARPLSTFEDFRHGFSRPDAIYAPFMFWFWDTPLDEPAEQLRLADMAQTMLEQRLNPGYVHARFNMVGLPDLPREQWLSPLWFDTFSRVVDKVEAAQAYVGFCGDFWWPSGQAAGRVLQKHPDLWATSLFWETIDVAGGSMTQLSASFFVVAAQVSPSSAGLDGRTITQSSDELLTSLRQRRVQMVQSAEQQGLEVIPHVPAVIKSRTLHLVGSGNSFAWSAPADGVWRLYVFNKYFHPGCDGGRLNYLDRRLADAFIDEALEPYAEQLPRALGARIPGMFLDHEGDDGYKLAWSDDLAEHYHQKTGEDIRLWMPLLFDTDEDGRFFHARWDWFDCVSDVYTDYFQAVTDWCTKHNLWTVSNLWEETLMWQAGAVGDFFKAQRVFTMPGTDALGLNVLQPHDFMETKSVCEFENRRQQSEIMGGAGFWGFTPNTLKQAANAAVCWGVSHVTAHAVFATRKLDGNPWLPDWFDEHPWWPHLHLWSDFVRRASYVNSFGNSAADVLLLNPMDSVWGLCGPGVFDPAFQDRVPVPAVQPMPTPADIPQTAAEMKRLSAWWLPPRMNEWFDERVTRINTVYSQAMEDLVQSRIEFLVADRYYLRQMQVEGNELVRPPFRFHCLVLPAMVGLPLEAAEKLVAFAKNGGRVILLETVPSASVEGGLNDPRLLILMKELIKLPTVKLLPAGSLQPELATDSSLASHIRFESGAFNMLLQHRRLDDRDFFWLVNNTGVSQSCRLFFQGLQGSASKWNCETGDINQINFASTAKGSSAEVEFSPYEAFWLVVDRQTKTMPLNLSEVEERLLLKLDGQWRISVDSTRQPEVEHPFYFSSLQSLAWSDLLRPWSEWGLGAFSGYIDYEIEFILTQPEGRVLLDLGDVKYCAEATLNDRPVGERLWPPFRFDLTDALLPGHNRLRVRVGNLLNNCYGDQQLSGLLGPVFLVERSEKHKQ